MSSRAESLAIPEVIRVLLLDGEIKEMPLEDYLTGVVPSEMGRNKPPEALKAQAIAARSYAAVSKRHATEGADVCITEHCQVWRPENRYPESDRAVEETRGQVVTIADKIAGVPYFAHCDGRTRDSEQVWQRSVPYLRSVPCICGYDKLYGHGVGMCQRGAIAMARAGASAVEILTHYYQGVRVACAIALPRNAFRRSVLLGRVVDGECKPLSGLGLDIRGSEGRHARRTNANGQFWVSGLPIGVWDVRVLGRPVRYEGIETDGRNIVDVNLRMPDDTPLRLKTTPMAHPLQLVGTLGYDYLRATIEDAEGEQIIVVGGSAPSFGPGGFSVPLPPSGHYCLEFLGQRYPFEIGESGLWLQLISERD